MVSFLNYGREDVNFYEHIENLYKDLWSKNNKLISLFRFAECVNCIDFMLDTSRQIWTVKKPELSFGIATDEDKGDIFTELHKKMIAYVQNTEKAPKYRPFINVVGIEQLTQSFIFNRPEIPFWSIQIPVNLEYQLAIHLKQKYPEFNNLDDHKIIRAVRRKERKSVEQIIRESVYLCTNDIWFKNYLQKLATYLKWAL